MVGYDCMTFHKFYMKEAHGRKERGGLRCVALRDLRVSTSEARSVQSGASGVRLLACK